MNNSDSPQLVSEEVSLSEITQELFLPQNLIYFQGHFPDLAILPGVVQLKWAIELAGKLCADPNKPLRTIKRLKFTNIIRPESTVSLNVAYNADKGFATFRYFDAEHVYSQGQLHCK